jgi:hypothetical protein
VSLEKRRARLKSDPLDRLFLVPRLSLTVLAACWALALVGSTAQTPAKARRTSEFETSTHEAIEMAMENA